MLTKLTYRVLPYSGANSRQISEVVNNAMGGKLNNTSNVTLTASSATQTSIDDPRIGVNSVLLFTPTSSAGMTFHGDMFVSARAEGSAVITHSVNTSGDRTFAFAIIG